MARVYGLEKLAAVSRAARKLDREVQRDAVKGLRRALAPVVPDARARYSALGGTGPRVARTVGMTANQKRVELYAGGSSVPFWGGREFGASQDSTRVYTWRNQFGKGIEFEGVKRIPYSSDRMFGRNTGTKGRAFVAATSRGLRRANREADDLAKELIEKLARAGEGA